MIQIPSLRHLLLAAFAGAAGLVAGPAPLEPTYARRGPVLELVQNETEFAPFAAAVSRDADRLLRDAARLKPARLKLLLAIRVHLAIHRGEGEVALTIADRIRELQTDPAMRAYTGLTTQAFVKGWDADRRGPGSPGFVAAFRQEFAAQLSALPPTPAVLAVLAGERTKNAALDSTDLQRQLQARVGSAIPPPADYTLEEVNQIVRTRHQLADLLPVRAAMLAELDAAIAARAPAP